MRPYLAHAACVVAPLRIARGVQNKVLEAMAMARPVVVTPQAAEGIRAVDGRDFQRAGDETAFAAAVVAALRTGTSNPDARTSVLARYDWERNVAAIDPLLDAAVSAATPLETCPA